METAPLKSFATGARTELIREVTARITAVLAQGSPERVEQPKAVTALERAIAGGGGGDKGKAHVVDKVAYTWFNRIIALRFMDANGYTGIGVVSPAADQVGQPEVLAAAKRGQVDREVVSKEAEFATITGLLNGTRQPRPGVDPQAEAYALLLADYCRYWNAAMPFMFEREGDFTELLIPANLLAGDSFLSRCVTVLTKDVCREVEVIGWLYQFYISELKDEVFAGFKKKKKAGADEIPPATQLFTPHWIVRYLVENSLGRLWMVNRPNSGLASRMDYYIAPVDAETDFLKIAKPEELKVIDPACGSGHMLTYAFDLLYAIYEEEGYAPSEISGLILANNLHGTEIDPRAGALAAFALTMKARARQRTFFNKQVEPSVCVIDPICFSPDEIDVLVTEGGDKHAENAFWNQFERADLFGALIRPPTGVSADRLRTRLEELSGVDGDLFTEEVLRRASQVLRQAQFLTRRYSAVIANPPYMGAGNMGAELATWVTGNYPVERQDLYACFTSLARRIALPGAYVAMIVGDTWLALPSFSDFRRGLLEGSRLDSLVHLDDVSNHPDIFGANTAFVLTSSVVSASPSRFVALEDNSHALKDEKLRLAALGRGGEWVHDIHTEEFKSVPGTVFAYKLTDDELAAFASGVRLGDIVSLREGINTGENERFLRLWWEVGYRRTSCEHPSGSRPPERWVIYKKGGAYRKWAGNAEFVLDWANDGAEIRASPRARPQNTQYFFKRSVSWTRISSGAFSLRYYGDGYAFDSTGPSAFGDDHSLEFALGFLNSNLAKRFLAALSPTLDYRLGNMGNLPGPQGYQHVDLDHVRELVSMAQTDWDERETAWGFESNPLVTVRATAIETAWKGLNRSWAARVDRTLELETLNNVAMAEAYGLHHVDATADRQRVSLWSNPEFVLAQVDSGRRDEAFLRGVLGELVSYAVGCIFGRYSLDMPGLILADQGSTLQDYLAKVPSPTLMPDADNVIPIVDGDWFEDDVVGLFRQFLRAAFGEQHFEENLKFVTESLGVPNLRDYFITKAGKSKFYDDHVQRYKKRPIYWLFSSPKGSFNALVYMHRYTPSTVSTVLTYLREYVTKLESSLQQVERAGNAKEADRLRKILVELNEYEHDTLYPKASENAVIDLDDGVKTNYPKFGAALRKIAGLEASGE